LEVLVDIVSLPWESGRYLLKEAEATIAANAMMQAQSKDQEELLSVYGVCQLSYRLISHICEGNEENEVYCAKFINSFFEHLGMNLGAAHTLTTLCKDNIQLVEDIDEGIVLRCLRFILERGKEPRFLNFLTAMCCVRGTGIQSKQEMICKVAI